MVGGERGGTGIGGSALGPAVIQCVQYSELERRLEDLETRLCLLVAAGCLHLERQGVTEQQWNTLSFLQAPSNPWVIFLG